MNHRRFNRGIFLSAALALSTVSGVNSQPNVAQVKLEFGENRLPIRFETDPRTDLIESIKVARLPNWICGQSAFRDPTGNRWNLNLNVCDHSLQPQVLDLIVVTSSGEEWKTRLNAMGPELDISNLISIYPNPFNSTLHISFTVPRAVADRHVKTTIYNELGQRVTVLLDREVRLGHQSVVWNGRDQTGRRVGSGVYYIRVMMGSLKATMRTVLVK